MTQDEIMNVARQASKEWLKEFPTPLETANQVPKRYLEIFAKLVAAKEREACAKLMETMRPDLGKSNPYADAIRARGEA